MWLPASADVPTTPILLVAAIYVSCVLLHKFLPGVQTLGYACSNDGRTLVYKLNGLAVSAVVCGAFFFLLPLSVQSSLCRYYGCVVFFANAIGLALSLCFYRCTSFGPERYARCLTVDQIDVKTGQPKSGLALAPVAAVVAGGAPPPPAAVLATFFLGRNWNPRVAGVDVKMLLYVVGATLLNCNILSCVAYQRLNRSSSLPGGAAGLGSSLSTAMQVYLFCFEWFLVEYLFFENVHLYTYDLFAEKVGFKLVWGCFVFYPCFYCIGAFEIAFADPTVDISPLVTTITLATFFLGWTMTRGANLQKYYYRTDPARSRVMFGLIPQRVLPGTRLLTSGFWGVSRHLNYFGEILQAVALALPGVAVGLAGGRGAVAFLPALYPVYYVLLFVPREMDDDKMCEKKYGEDWKRYKKEVPYRIVPFVW